MDVTAAQSCAGDYHNSCRLCLSKGGRQLPIFGPCNDNLGPLSSRILACVSVQVCENDDLPKQICHRCKCQINIWQYFKEECESSQHKLNTWNRIISRPSTHRNVLVEDGTSEIVSVKLEPGEHGEYGLGDGLNHCVDTENLDSCDGAGGTESINDDIRDCEDESCLNKGHTEAAHASPSSWNPVISATSTIGSSVGTRDGEEGPTDDVTGLAFGEQSDECGHNEGGEVSFIQPASPRSSCLEVNIEDDDASPQVLSINSNHNLSAIPEFATLNVSGLNPSTVSLDDLDDGESGDPLVAVKQEPIESSEVILKVKEEPVETDGDFTVHCQDDPSYHPQFLSSTRSKLRTLLSSTPLQAKRKKNIKTSSTNSSVIANPKNKKARYSMPSAGNDQVYNYGTVDLPKISNDLFDEESKYCKICNKSFLSSRLWRHIKDRHAELNPFACDACRKVFSGRREFVTHRVRTINKSCRAGKMPEDVAASTLIFHEDVSRGKRGRYECRECNLKFVQLSNAKAHTRLHTGEKPFFCYKCNKREFRLRKTALKHVAICRSAGKYDNPAFVSKEKPSSVKVSSVIKSEVAKQGFNGGNKMCPKCGKVFANAYGVANHLRVECLKKCSACLKFVPKEKHVKHYRQCLKSIHSPSVIPNTENISTSLTSSQSIKIASLPVSKNKGVKTSERKITKIVDLPVSKLWEMQLDEDGKSVSLVCQVCHKTLGSRKGLRAHVMKHSSKTFKCEICNKWMSLRSTYESHMSNIHDGYLKVPKVDLDFAKGDLSSSGQVAASQAKPVQSKFFGFKTPKFKCEICLKLFSSATSLKYHKKTHKRVKCQRCEITFPATMERSHICTPKVKVEPTNLAQEQTIPQVQLLAQKAATQYTCQLCKKKFHTRKMLYQHKKMHIKVKIYKCKMCCNSYSDAGALQQHKASAHASELVLQSESRGEANVDSSIAHEDDRPYECTVCHKGYTLRDSLLKHMKLHKKSSNTNVTALQKPDKPGVLFCNICDKSFTSKESFIRHKGWHSRQDLGKSSAGSVKSDTSATSNEKTSTSDPDCDKVPALEKTFDCDLCSKRFSTQKGLKCHAVCHEKVSSKVAIKKEIPPSGALPQIKAQHKCKICFKTFSDLALLSTHILTHSELSGNSSSDQGSILEDSPKELLQCKLCNKEYKCRKSLKYHMMGHSGEKPFKCRSCSNEYSNPKALSKHEKERHPIVLRPFCCVRCKTSFMLKEDLLDHHVKCSH